MGEFKQMTAWDMVDWALSNFQYAEPQYGDLIHEAGRLVRHPALPAVARWLAEHDPRILKEMAETVVLVWEDESGSYWPPEQSGIPIADCLAAVRALIAALGEGVGGE